MDNRALVNPVLRVNGTTIRYKGNSLVYNDGFGDTNVRVITGGGKDIVNVITSDIETQKGMVKFTLVTTTETAKNVRAWQSIPGENTVIISDDTGFTRTFQEGVIMSGIDVATGQEGETEVEFTTRKAV